MHPEPPLLEHPFYQAWERGEVSRGQLAAYGAAYQAFMDAVPSYWSRVLDGLDVEDPAGEAIVEEEREHALLWRRWRADLPAAHDDPALSDLFEALDGMSPAELAGALHAYEVQQPAVAETKKRGLCEHYGLEDADLTFFDEHMNEAEHIAFGEGLRDEHADPEAFDRGFHAGAEAIYHSLDAFTAA